MGTKIVSNKSQEVDQVSLSPPLFSWKKLSNYWCRPGGSVGEEGGSLKNLLKDLVRRECLATTNFPPTASDWFMQKTISGLRKGHLRIGRKEIMDFFLTFGWLKKINWEDRYEIFFLFFIIISFFFKLERK